MIGGCSMNLLLDPVVNFADSLVCRFQRPVLDLYMLPVNVTLAPDPLVDHTSHLHGLADPTTYTSGITDPFTLPGGLAVSAGSTKSTCLMLQGGSSCVNVPLPSNQAVAITRPTSL